MTTDSNKKLVEQLFKEVMNEKNLSFVDKSFAPNFKHHGIPGAQGGPAGFKATYQKFIDAFPDIQVHPEHFIAEGDLVATRGEMTGTNKGSFMGAAPAGKKFRIDYIDIWKVKDGKFTENWVSMDTTGIMTQVGLMPAHETA